MNNDDRNSKPNITGALKEIFETHEDWLMGRVLMYAKRQGYTAYTSTLKEAWRLSISGLSESLIKGLGRHAGVPEISPEEDLKHDPVAWFGIIEAKRHKDRGVSLEMFLGLMKYYRQAYVDLVRNCILVRDGQKECELFVNRLFDRIEIGFCVEWASEGEDKTLAELQARNRRMTNEKNKYLTLFESIPNPVILLDDEKKIDNLNYAAVTLFKERLSPGSQYYRAPCETIRAMDDTFDTAQQKKWHDQTEKTELAEFLPWLKQEVDYFYGQKNESMTLEKNIPLEGRETVFRIKLAKNLDISGKFDGTIIILEDITSLKQALVNVKQLSGLLPICSHCKKIRDDKGYWNQIEVYIDQHSEAKFSHGICQECAKKHYPDYGLYEGETK